MFYNAFQLTPPDSCLSTPVFLEHEPIVVGWCNLYLDELGLQSKDIKITDEIVKQKIQSGEIKGLSVNGIAKKTKCSICNQSIIDCNHIPGEVYDNQNCSNLLLECDLIEVSLVKEPINEKCMLNIEYI